MEIWQVLTRSYSKAMIEENNVIIHRGVEDLAIIINAVDEKGVDYNVRNTPICSWDQHSRARIGVEFLSYEVSNYPEYVFYTHVYDMMFKDVKFSNHVFSTLENLEKLRQKAELKDTYNLMSRKCTYRVKQTWDSLKGQMFRRLKFCEEEFIVGLHWLLRDILIKRGWSQAGEFKPFCDVIQKCDYSQADYLSNMFGCLFAGCNRWPDESEFASFNESCTDKKELEDQLEIEIPNG